MVPGGRRDGAQCSTGQIQRQPTTTYRHLIANDFPSSLAFAFRRARPILPSRLPVMPSVTITKTSCEVTAEQRNQCGRVRVRMWNGSQRSFYPCCITRNKTHGLPITAA